MVSSTPTRRVSAMATIAITLIAALCFLSAALVHVHGQALEYQPYVGWLPVIYNVFPQLATTAGGTQITMYGYRLTGNDAGRLPVINIRKASDGSVQPCTIVCPDGGNNYYGSSGTATGCWGNAANMMVCTLPPGDGVRYLDYTLFGNSMTQLARWPTDMFFADSTAGASTKCTAIYNTAVASAQSSYGWTNPTTGGASTNWLCAYDTKANWFYQWVQDGSTPACPADLTKGPAVSGGNKGTSCTMKCVGITNAAENSAISGSWTGRRLCWDSRIPFDLTWYESGAPTTSACISWRDRNDPYWTSSSATVLQLCAPANVPYGGGDSWTYTYARPVITAVTPLKGETVGGTLITITGQYLSTSGTITIGGKTCSWSTWAANVAASSTVVCQLPAGEGTVNAVVVNVAGQTSTGSFNFVYNPPFVQSISQPAGASWTSGYYPVTITGYNFGTTTGSVTIGFNNCPVTGWANKQIICTVLPGMGAGLAVTVSTLPPPQTSNSNITFSYTIPTINSGGINPSTYSTAGGVLLTLTGNSFGQAGVVTIGGSTCFTNSWSDQTVICQLPSGSGTSSALVILVQSLTNVATVYPYKPPSIATSSGILPVGGSPGGSLTINGDSFGTFSQGSVLVNGVACTSSLSSWDHTRIICTLPTTPAGSVVGASVPVSVTVTSQVTNPTGTFAYLPIITTFSVPGGVKPTSGNVDLSIVGTSFTASTTAVTVGGKTCSVKSSTTTNIVCTLPAGQGLSQSIYVIVNSLSNVNPSLISYDPPTLTGITPSSGSSGGGYNVTLVGGNFGLNPTANPTQVLIGTFVCDVKWQNHTAIICTTRAGSGVSNPVTVAVSGQTTSQSVYFTYFAPTLSQVVPSNGPTGGGTTITLYGTGFATSGIVVIGGTVVNTYPSSSTMTTFVLPAGQGITSLYISIDSQASANLPFTYDGPFITTTSPSGGATEGPVVLTIDGTSFGTGVVITVGGLTCVPTVASQTGTHRECTVPQGDGFNQTILMSVGTQVSNPKYYNYNVPSISTISSLTGVTAGGNIITIYGSSFGRTGTVFLGSYQCVTNVAGTSWAHTQIACQVTAGEGANLPIVITVNGQTNVVSQLFSYGIPTISSITPANGPTVGGTSLLVRGTNFGLTANITIADRTCAVITNGQSHTQFECLSPPGQGKNQVVVAKVAGQVSTSSLFNYNAPTVTGLTPTTGPTTGGTVVTLTGTNFGIGNAGTVTVTMGGFTATGVTVVDTTLQTRITFVTPVGTGASLSTILTVASQSVTYSATLFSYAKPTITQAYSTGCPVNTATMATECPLQGGVPLTLTGTNYGIDSTKVSVTVGGISCPLVGGSLTQTSVTCTLPANPNGSANMAIIITVSSQTGTAALVSYLGPSITEGTLVQINPPPSSRRLLAVSLNMADTNGNVTIRFSGKYFGNNNSAITVRYGLPATSGTTAAVAFAAKPFVCAVIGVRQDGTGVSSVDCIVPAAMGRGLVFQVRVIQSGATQVSAEGADLINYPAPYIRPSSIRLSLASASGGSSVIGANSAGDLVFFDVDYLGPLTTPAVSSLITVKFGPVGQAKNHSCYNPVVGIIGNRPWLSCTTEQGTGSSYVFLVTANGQDSNEGTDYYTYVTPPSVTSVTGCPSQSATNSAQTIDCPTEGALQLTIHGEGFGQQNLSVRVGVNSATNIIYVSPTLLYADLPAGTGSPVDVVVSVGQLFSSSTPFLYYHAATIDTITGCVTDESSGNSTYDCNRYGGDVITVTGTNFGPADPAATVIVGGKLCTGVVHGVNGTLVHRQLTCTLATGTLANVPLLVIQGLGVLTTAVPTVSYTLCARGYYALAGVLACSPCDVGTYSDVLGLTSCKQCDSGTYAGGSNSTICTACSAGTYSVRDNGLGPSSCTPCDRGSITSATGQVACTPCESGTYTNQTSQSICTQCSPGFFSTQSLVGSVAYGATSCVACIAGKYQASSGKSDCDLCPSGTAAPNTNSSSCTPCAVGTFSAGGIVSTCTPCSTGSYTSTTSSQSCKQCDSGKYSNDTALSTCYTCLAGSYSGVGASSCIPCAAKSYTSSDGQPSCTLCSQGLFSNTTGLTVCYSCAQGFFAKDAGLTVCAACTAGYYSEVLGSVSCPPCDTGSFSDSGASTCTKCSAGNFQSTTGQSACTPCPKGMAISVSGGAICLDCEPGKFANTTGLSVCYTCQAGSYSQLSATTNTDGARGATICSLCELGKYTSATSAASCDPVPIGHYAANLGQTEADRCAAGTISGSGAAVCTNCTSGSYAASTGSAVCTQCPQGSFNDRSGLAECYQCPPGYYQPTSGQGQCFACGAGKITGDYGKTVCSDCSTATYQNATGQSTCITCSVGSYQATTGKSTCILCTEGSFQKSPGSLSCDKCRSGYVTNYTGASTCDICAAGYYADVGQSVCQECAAGTSGPVAGLGACEPCDAGKYSSENRSLSCTDCRKGTVQPNSQQTSCSNCEIGKSQASTGQLECNLCGLGYFANVPGFENCEPCQTGRFSDTSGFTACAFCSVGKYQDQQHATTCVACSPGSYTAANGSAICTSCSPGTGAVNAGQTECTPCYASTYAVSNGTVVCSACPTGSAPFPTMTQEEIDQAIADAKARNITDLGVIFESGWLECPACPAGRYQDREGSYVCKVCPEGKYTKVSGQFQCTACSAGTYAIANVTHGNTICINCAAGKYQSATGTSACFDCLVGTYSGTDGQPRCTSCDSGSYTARNGSIECDKCAPGYHQSAQGQQNCESCPVGTFTNRDGQAQCQQCSAGTRANFPLGGATNCTACDLGYYQSSPGSTFCLQCGVGSFTGAQGQDSCTTCPAGTFAPANGSAECTPCPVGYQQDAQGQTSCFQCTAGTYTNATRQLQCTLCGYGTIAPNNASIVCDACPSGTYQQNFGKTACNNCSIGSAALNPQAQECTKCIPGYYAPVVGLSECLPCAKGYAQPEPGGVICNECPVGTSSQAGSSDCQKCADRFIAPQRGMESCLVCDNRATSNADSTLCECAVGWAAKYPPNGTVTTPGFDPMYCVECPTGADCNSKGKVWLELVTIAGYWTQNQNFYRCLLITHCDSNSTCGAHRNGILCTQCEDGYTEGLGGGCNKCASSGTSYFTFILVSALILAAVILQMYVLLRSGRDLIAVAERDEILKEREQAGFVEEYDPDWEWRANRYDDKITIYGPPAPKANFTFKLKIALSFAQIVSNLAIGIDIQWPPEFKQFMSWLSPANLDFIQFSSVGCVMSANYYSKMILVAFLPFAIFAGLFVFYWLPKNYVLRRDKLGKKMVRRKFWKLFLFTLFLIYPSCSSTVLRIFVCRRVEGVDYLLSDFSLTCYDAEWRKYAAIAGIMIAVYPIGIPAFFFRMLWAYRHRLEEIGVRAQLGFLYDAYTRDMWWFEMLDVAHKLCVTCIIAFLPYSYQMPIGMVFVIAYTGVILLGRPYLRKSDDRLHLVSQVELLLLLMSGNIFNREIIPDDLMSTVLSVVLIAAVLTFFLFFVVQAVQAGLKLISSFRKANAAQKLKLEGEADASTTPERDEDGNVIEKPQSRMDKTMLKMADELERLKKKDDNHPEFTISRRQLRPMSRQHGEELRNFHMKANPLFEGHTALYDPTDKDNIVDDIKVNPLYAAKMRRELDEEDNSARSHLSPKQHKRTQSDLERLKNEFGVARGQGTIQEVAEDGKIIEEGPRRDDDDDASPRGLDSVEMSVFKQPEPARSQPSSPALPTGSLQIQPSAATTDPSGAIGSGAASPVPAGDTPASPLGQAQPDEVKKSGTDAFDDDGPRKPRNRGFDEDDDQPRKKDRSVD